MTKKTNFYLWWFISCLVLMGTILYFLLVAEDKSLFLIGETTSGHYQIELKCESCHTKAFNDKDDIQAACVRCHADELVASDDSHPKSKFTDPRNAEYIDILDARYCVSCHTEHQENRTLPMGLTLPADYCFYCHHDIAEDRPSHKDLAFDSCASAGCHNFHDNRALYEDFLAKHLNEPKIKYTPEQFTQDTLGAYLLLKEKPIKAIASSEAKYPSDLSMDRDSLNAALTSSHARAGVDCTDCHRLVEGDQSVWVQNPSGEQCDGCHELQTQSFLSGKHGMRLNVGLTPMSPKIARSIMKSGSSEKRLSCNSCHAAHEYDTKHAAVDGCLGCHDDKHSRAFFDSPHYQLWQQAMNGEIAESRGVSCASCHLPRELHSHLDKEFITVQHNQNDNLRPNEKMIRSVCVNCHSVEFSIDALADPDLISKNFLGMPSEHVKSLDMVRERQ